MVLKTRLLDKKNDRLNKSRPLLIRVILYFIDDIHSVEVTLYSIKQVRSHGGLGQLPPNVCFAPQKYTRIMGLSSSEDGMIVA